MNLKVIIVLKTVAAAIADPCRSMMRLHREVLCGSQPSAWNEVD
jgi:hypothetical protein